MERAKLQIEEMRQSRMSESLARRLQKKIVQDLELATTNDPTLGEAYLLTAKLTAGTDPDKAQKALDDAIKNLDRDRERQGEAYAVRSLFQENFDDKLKDLRQALKLVPESIEVQRTLFAMLLDKKRFEEVYELGKELLEVNSKNPISLQATVSALLELNRRDEAIELINKLIDDRPTKSCS